MILLEPPVFSLTKELLFFTAFVVVVIALIILVEIEYKRSLPKSQGGQRILPGAGPLLQEMPILPEPPVEDDTFFNEIEEYRNDFDDDPQAS